MPTRVAADLQICRVAQPTRWTYVHDFQRERLVVRPGRLPKGAHGFYDDVRWRSWRRREAVGRAVLDYADRTARFRVPVYVRLYGAQMCPDGVWIITERRVTAIRAADRSRIAFDARGVRYGSCQQAQYERRIVNP